MSCCFVGTWIMRNFDISTSTIEGKVSILDNDFFSFNILLIKKPFIAFPFAVGWEKEEEEAKKILKHKNWYRLVDSKVDNMI